MGNSEICPKKSCNPFSLLCWLRRELRDECFASLRFRDVHGEMDLSLSRSLESTKHRTDPCSISRVLSEGRKGVPQVQYIMPFHTVGALYFGSDLAHFEVLHVSHAVDHVLRLLAEWVVCVILLSGGLSTPLGLDASQIGNQLFDCFLVVGIFLLDC